VYDTPSEICMSFSTTSSSTITRAGALRPVGGGTLGGGVSTARIGAPCGAAESALAARGDATGSTARTAARASAAAMATTTIAAAVKTLRSPQVMAVLL
jgi:hypothetical protein